MRPNEWNSEYYVMEKSFPGQLTTCAREKKIGTFLHTYVHPSKVGMSEGRGGKSAEKYTHCINIHTESPIKIKARKTQNPN